MSNLNKQFKRILVAGSGSSMDLLPVKTFNGLIISMNYSYLYFNQDNNHINLSVDCNKEDWIKHLKENNEQLPECEVLTKYDFEISEPWVITKDKKKLAASAFCSHRALELAYKFRPEKIYIIGLDLQGMHAKKIQKFYPEDHPGHNYSNPALNKCINEEYKRIEYSLKLMRQEGIKVFNLSPVSRFKQNMTIEGFING